MKNTQVISGFPGVGKTTYKNKVTDLTVLDSDSSQFAKDYFPHNYMAWIEYNLGKVDVILVSSHAEVRKALIENGIPYTLIVPDISLLEEYKNRYIGRGSTAGFVNLLETNWSDWLSHQTDEHIVVLKSGEYLSDVLPISPKM